MFGTYRKFDVMWTNQCYVKVHFKVCDVILKKRSTCGTLAENRLIRYLTKTKKLECLPHWLFSQTNLLLGSQIAFSLHGPQ